MVVKDCYQLKNFISVKRYLPLFLVFSHFDFSIYNSKFSLLSLLEFSLLPLGSFDTIHFPAIVYTLYLISEFDHFYDSDWCIIQESRHDKCNQLINKV